ncbi:MAG: Hsp20/alpha crystallin family protein [Pirellulales bacterium]|nr:Hsp20/alpha crystallin family protein [Pirellulales bacterium]
MSIETPVAEPSTAVEHTRGGPYYRPSVDIFELADELVVLADVAGAKSDEIDVQFEDGSLTIHARVPQRQSGDVGYLRQEYGVGDFYRTFRVSEHIDSTRISAEYHDGVLKLHLPKVEAVKPRKIKVNAE